MSKSSKDIKALFLEALNVPEKDRAAFLDESCGDDAECRSRMEKMLRAHEEHDSSFDELLTLDLDNAFRALTDRRSEELAGRYRLNKKIGEGGVSVVYQAEQFEPVQRPVAVKVIKLGMDTLDVIDRFEKERRAVALMDHPNIAKIFDAGSTEDGRPFFVMELVEGIPLLKFCETEKLSIEQRLKLLGDVCNAVQHAHQKGIVHRDLKPANVLVEKKDLLVIPRVIDFGISKAIEGRLFDPLSRTHQYTFLGTPVYTSPEQALGSSQDVDTRSDIYSLGVILYELIAGVLPFDPDILKDKSPHRLYEELQQTLIQAPSLVLNKLPQIDRERLAEMRSTTLRQHYNQLIGDLDWIVLRCLEKQRDRRYQTVNALAVDIEKYLEGDPVSARPPTKVYLLQKFIKRHKVAVFAGTAVAASLIIGLLISIFSLQRERLAREQTSKQANHLVQVTQLLNGMLEGVDLQVAMGRDTLLLSEILDQAIHQLESDPSPPPEVEADLREILGKVYFDLGQHEASISVLERSLELRRNLGEERSNVVFRSLVLLGRSFFEHGKYEKAEAYLRQALDFGRTRSDLDPLEMVAANDQLSDVLIPPNGRRAVHHKFIEEAITLRRESVQILLQEFGPEDLSYARSLVRLALILVPELSKNGKPSWKEADNLFQEALHIFERQLGKEHPEYAITLLQYGMSVPQGKSGVLIDLGFTLLDKSELNMDARLYADLVEVSRSLGFYNGRPGRTENLLLRLLQAQKEFLGEEHPQIIETLKMLGRYQDYGAKFEETRVSLESSLALAEKLLGPNHFSTLTILSLLVTNSDKLKKLDEQERYFQRWLERHNAQDRYGMFYLSVPRISLLREKRDWVNPAIRELLARRQKLLQDDKMTEASDPIRMAHRQIIEKPSEEAKAHYLSLADGLDNYLDRSAAAGSLYSIGLWFKEAENFAEAEWALREAVKRVPNHLTYANNINWHLAHLLLSQDKVSELQELVNEEIARQESTELPNLKRTQSYQGQLIDWYLKHEDLASADALIHQLLSMARQRLTVCSDIDGFHFVQTLNHLIYINRFEESEAFARDCLVAWREHRPNSYWIYEIQNKYGHALLEQGKWEEAELALMEVQRYNAEMPDYLRGGLPTVATELINRLYSEWDLSEEARQRPDSGEVDFIADRP